MRREEIGQAWILSSVRVALADAALGGGWSGPDAHNVYTLKVHRGEEAVGRPLEFSARTLSRCSTDAGVQAEVLVEIRKWLRGLRAE